MLKLKLSRKKQSFFLLFAALLLSVGVFLFTYSKARAADTVSTSATTTFTANVTGSMVVFISDQTGYSFFRTSTGTAAYAKTTNGGTTWGSPVTVDSQTDTLKMVVWYDRWTPGDTTGTLIYIAITDTGSSDVWYRTLDTSGDTLSGSGTVSITSTPGPNKSNSFGSGAGGFPSITKGTDGVLYSGISDNTSSYILMCSTTCTTASNWSDAGTNPLTAGDINWHVLVPLASGVIMAIEHDDTVDDTQYQTWNGSSWSGSWVDIDANCIVNSSAGSTAMGATADRSSGAVYLVEACDNVTLGTNDDIRSYSYSGGSWTTKTDVLTNDARGLINSKIARDENSGDLYVIYSATASGTPTDLSTKSLYWKKSTDGMTSWGSESASIAGPDTIDTTTINYSSNERIYAIWGQDNGGGADTINGATLADLVSNTAPAAPTLSTPANAAMGVSITPQFQMRTTDADNDYLQYKIEVCSNSDCSSVVRTIDQTSSQTGWSGQDQQTSTAYTGSSTLASSTMATHTYQTPALSTGTQYWWRAYAIDPGGLNTFSSASSISTFTTNTVPGTPILIFPDSSATGVASSPIFQLRTTDTDNDYLQYFIQIYDATACGGSQVGSNIDQTSSQTGWQAQDANSAAAYAGSSSIGGSTIARYQYSGTALTPNHLYSWRAKAIDPGGSNIFSSLTSCQDFTTGSSEVNINGGTTINGGTLIQ